MASELMFAQSEVVEINGPYVGEAEDVYASYNSNVPIEPCREFNLDLDTAGRLFRSGLLVVDNKRLILYANAFAKELLQVSGAPKMLNGCLTAEKAHLQRTIEMRFVQVANAVEQGEFDASDHPFIGISDRTGAVQYAIKIVSAVKTASGIELMLAIINLIDRVGPSRATFSSVFHLSERESELTELFSRGFRLEQIATQMGVSLNTARVHLRNVLAKTNCAAQSELMRMLMRLS